MRSTIAVAALLSIATATDSHRGHFAFHNKRQDTDLEQCTTVWSTWFGEATMAPLPPPPTTSSTSSSSLVESTSSTSTSTSSSSSSTPPPPPPTSTKAAPVQTSASPSQGHVALQTGGGSSSGGGSGSGGAGSDFWGHSCGSSGMNAITYSPYKGPSHAESSCESDDEIRNDIQQIHDRGFNRIRIYATDCDQLKVGGAAAQALGMRLIAGIFLNSPGSADSDFEDQISEIKSYISGGGNNIDAVLVGNEPFKGGHATVDQVASYLQKARSALPSNIQVSSALTHDELEQYGDQLCSHMDVVAAQIHPFFSSSYIAPWDAGSYVESQMGLMSGICGGKATFVSESGYPNGGGSWFGQIAGAIEQSAAIKSIKNSDISNHITIFSSSQDTWKLASGVAEYEAAFDCLGLF